MCRSTTRGIDETRSFSKCNVHPREAQGSPARAREEKALLIGIDGKENHAAKRATAIGAMHLTVLSKDLRALVVCDNI